MLNTPSFQQNCGQCFDFWWICLKLVPLEPLPLQTVILTWVWVFWKILCPPNVPSQMSKSHNIATLYQDLHEMWILQGCLLICRIKYTFTKLQRNLHNNNSTEKTEWGHNLVSKAYKVSDHHLHHGEPWQAAMTTQWLHQLLMEDVVKHIIMSPKSGHAIIQNLGPEFPLHFWKHQGDSLMMLARPLKRQPKCNHKISELT
jgi:hypothetical protein